MPVGSDRHFFVKNVQIVDKHPCAFGPMYSSNSHLSSGPAVPSMTDNMSEVIKGSRGVEEIRRHKRVGCGACASDLKLGKSCV